MDRIPDATNVRIVLKGDGEIWGTWYFLTSWILLIVRSNEPHGSVMQRYQIPKEQVELCGWFNGDNVLLRDSCDWELQKPVMALVKAEIIQLKERLSHVPDVSGVHERNV